MTLTALIADDEPLARDVLRFLLAEHDDVEIVGEAASGRKALAEILRLRPAVVFLDIQMPGWSGFDTVARIDAAAMPEIVFVTAFDEHALRAFEVRALDYLVKPVDPERLAAAVRRVRERIEDRALRSAAQGRQHAAGMATPGGGFPADRSRLAVRSGSRRRWVTSAEVDWVEAAGDYVYLHCGDRRHLLRTTMVQLEEELDPALFQRVHRSAIVNLERLVELSGLDHGELRLVLSDGTPLKCTRTYKKRLERALGRHRAGGTWKT